MGLETAPQAPLGRIDPNSMIGLAEPVVTPSAVSALSDAFRKGVVTSDDIIARYGELAQSRKKSELQTLDEGRSQPAVDLRSQTTATQMDQQKALQGQAQGAQLTAEQQKKLTELGPAGELGYRSYLTLMSEAGEFEVPRLPTGEPDLVKMSAQGLQWASQKVEQADAQAALKDGKRVLSADGTLSGYQDSLGKLMTTAEYKDKYRRATSRIGKDFNKMVPGSIQAAPGVAAPVATVIPAIGDFHNPEIDVGAPAAPAPGAAAVPSTSASGGRPFGAETEMGTSLGERPTVARTNVPPPVELEQQLVELQKTGTDIQQAQSLIQGAGNNVVGPMVGNIITRTMTKAAAALGSDAAQHQINAQRNLEMLRSRKILEGAQKMKGNLSDKDIRFLQDTIPGLTDDEALWSDFLSKWEAMNSATQRVLKGELKRTPDGTYSMPDVFWNAPAPGAQPGASTGQPGKEHLLDGKRFRRAANGVDWEFLDEPVNSGPAMGEPGGPPVIISPKAYK